MSAPARRLALLAAVALLGLLAQPRDAGATPPWQSREDILCRASSAVGYSYWWGGGCWCSSGCSPSSSCSTGGCSGSCPSCNHWGSYGADCSGFVNKVWQVPGASSTSSCGHGPYVANSYRSSGSYWNVISRSSALPGDAMATSSHVLLYEAGDPWGWGLTYEARGCSYGIVHNWRTIYSGYVASRRINISSCQCDVGQTQTQACGNCGSKQRTCGGNCQWGSWTGCQGQGACSPGSVDVEGCCDCGTKSRSCSSSCEWDAWTGCAGPDPQGGGQVCDTGELGPCADGRVRCEAGCLECVRAYEPIPELCDAVDNDCNGQTDEGDPTQMGATAPRYAASASDCSYPASLQPGETAEVWVEFDNRGTEVWQRGEVWLGSVVARDGEASSLEPDDGWPAWDVAASLDEDVPPGSSAFLLFEIRASQEVGDRVVEGFRLLDPGGRMMDCPAPEVRFDVTVRPADEPGPRPFAQPEEAPVGTMGCTCDSAGWGEPPVRSGLALLLLLFGARSRQRRRR